MMELEAMKLRTMNVLVMTNSVDGYEAIKNTINNENSQLNAVRIEFGQKFKEAVDKQSWDVIISGDCLSLPDAIAALKWTKKSFPLLPFIIISDTPGEEHAVNAMRSGANDYLLKKDLNRLPLIINREIESSLKAQLILDTDNLRIEGDKRYRLLAENIQDLVCLHHPDSTYAWVSPSVKKILGYFPEELVGTKHVDLIHEDDLKQWYLDLFKYNIPKDGIRIWYRLRRKNGDYIYLETMLQPVFDEDTLIQITSTSRDVTEQKIAHDSLTESEARYQGVIESIAEGLIIYDEKGHVTAFNKSAAKVLAIKAISNEDFQKELMGRFKFFRPNMEMFPFDEFPSKVTFRTKKPCSRVIMGLKDKHLIWLSVNSAPLLQTNNKIGVVVSFSDITEQKVYEDRIIAVARELTTVIDTANAPIFGIDWNGEINEWNQVSAKITGYSKAEVIGKRLIDEFILDGYKVSVTDLLKSALRGKEVTNYELPIYTRTGKIVTILFNATPRRNLDKEIVGVLGVGQNITELIEYRESLELKVAERTKELNLSLQKEKELVALKSKFVSMASHEFRTPLSTIAFATNYVKRYKSKLDYAEIDRKLDKIEEQVKHMTYLLDDILTIGKNESGKIKLNPTMVDIKGFCKKIIEEVTHSTNGSHKLLLSLETERKEIWVDEKLLRNILINLLTNAIKFSPGKNKVLLEVVFAHKKLSMLVRDWGMGIEQEDYEKIFDPFHRTNAAGAIQGTGLGLSIVKKAVELQNGVVAVSSELGKGTAINIEIPIKDEEDTGH